ncbi:MAG: heme-binding domain-containing protein [Acidobacteriota bacterium]|jgi:hypothetical protein
MRRIIWIVGILVVAFLVVMQFRQPDYNLSAPSANATFAALHQPDPDIQNTLQRSCYNCHSTQGKIPWYGMVWPTSQLLQNDVRQGRAMLDFSNWDNLSPEMARIRLLSSCRSMREGKMPLWYYRPLHPGTAPTPGEIDAFCAWAQALPTEPNTAQLR